MATLATRFGWSYEALMTMTGAERRLWLAAADRVGEGGNGGVAPSPAPAAGATAEPQRAPVPRVPTEEERRARLLELTKEFAARYRR